MNAEKLSLHVRLQDKAALDQIKAELAKGDGVKRAAARLGVAQFSLYRWGAKWPALGKLIAKAALDPETAGAMRLSASKKTKRRKAK